MGTMPEIPGRVGGIHGAWRMERARLIEQQSAAVRRRKRCHLPFAKASAVVQSHGLKSKEDWDEWLELGEGWSAYVPRDPEGYYRAKGEWLGWRVFLTGDIQ